MKSDSDYDDEIIDELEAAKEATTTDDSATDTDDNSDTDIDNDDGTDPSPRRSIRLKHDGVKQTSPAQYSHIPDQYLLVLGEVKERLKKGEQVSYKKVPAT